MEIVLHPRSPTLAWIRSLGKPNFWEVSVFVCLDLPSDLLKITIELLPKDV